MKSILIVGLGNPGDQYTYTRHNAGFLVLDKFAEAHNFPDFVKKGNAMVSVSRIGDSSIILMKPQTYMNLSGDAVWPVVSFFKIPKDNVFVIHDDLDIKLGNVKLKFAGSSGGHNGIKSIDGKISSNYWRIRIGIGRPTGMISVADYVLQKFSNDEMSVFDSVSNELIPHIDKIIQDPKLDKQSKKTIL